MAKYFKKILHFPLRDLQNTSLAYSIPGILRFTELCRYHFFFFFFFFNNWRFAATCVVRRWLALFGNKVFVWLFAFKAAPVACGSSRIGVESKLQLWAYTTATATWDPSCIYDLYHSSQQCQIPDPLSETRDQTCILMDTSRICFRWATTRIPSN